MKIQEVERLQKLKMEDTMDKFRHLRLTFALLTSRLVGFEIFGAGSNFSREVARCKSEQRDAEVMFVHLRLLTSTYVKYMEWQGLHVMYEKRISTIDRRMKRHQVR